MKKRANLGGDSKLSGALLLNIKVMFAASY